MPYLVKPKAKPIRKVNVEDRQKIYQSARWQRLRMAKLMEQPLCEICLAKGIITPAEDVHHKDGFLNYEGLDRIWKAFDFNNLMSVCKQCHAALHKDGRTIG